MLQRHLLFTLVVLSGACSQRAPWRVVPAPTAQPADARPNSPQPARPPSLALAAPDVTAVAALPSLFFPVPSVDSTRLDDSFDSPRDGGRKHNAIDIMASRGAPVLSVEDGRILRLSRNGNGGITIYASDASEQYVFYYAHLDGYHKNLYQGRPILRGDTLGYVGTTGNAPKNTPHLHFQMMRMPADGRFWNGDPVNPYPLLRRSPAQQAGK